MRIRAKNSNTNGQELDAYGRALVNTNLGDGPWTKRHNAVLLALASELTFVNNIWTTDVYGLFEGKFGDGSPEAGVTRGQAPPGGTWSKRLNLGAFPNIRPKMMPAGEAPGRSRALAHWFRTAS